ncbi:MULTISPECIES: hypothetical protein [Amycolatopsis]|uniref:hypothetical protein n=1 Tax=Amycolatopsis TaxID=1813 RepID=UPI001E49E1FA|nr:MULTISPECIES: hypothetical protein [Amycolatopsis]
MRLPSAPPLWTSFTQPRGNSRTFAAYPFACTEFAVTALVWIVMTSSAPPPPGKTPGDASAREPRRGSMPGTPSRRASGRSFERTLFTEPVLYVSREAEPTTAGQEYGVFDRHGLRIGGVAVTTPSFPRRVIQHLWKSDQYVSRRFEVRDANQSTVLKVEKPSKDPSAHFVVTRADRTPIGEIIPTDAGRVRFTLRAEGKTIATVVASGRQRCEVTVEDPAGTEVAQVGIPSPELSPISGNACLAEIPQQVPEPLASMLVATTLTIDIALTA